MIITKVQLKNWKNFGDVDANCGKRVFLIGPNASGKSNFLDALRFLRDVAQDGLKKAVDARGGIKAVRYLCARSPSHVSIVVNLDEIWKYGLSFTSGNKGEPRIIEEYVNKFEDGKESEILLRPDKDDKRDAMRLTQTALQQVNVNSKFRDVANFFSSIQYRHILPQLVRDPKSFSPLPSKNDPYGRDLVSQIWNTPKNVRDARLRKINQALIIAVPNLKDLSVEQDKATGLPHLKVNYEHWRPHGGFQNESAFSDGTLRLLTLLWSIFDAEGPLLLEEPELSLHETIIKQLPGMFTRLDRTRKKIARQIFITTHSEAMLSDPGIGANEVLRLEPYAEGTVIQPAEAVDKQLMVEGGLSAAEVLLPKTRPHHIEQLSLFPEK
jgi:predicted ATPase